MRFADVCQLSRAAASWSLIIGVACTHETLTSPPLSPEPPHKLYAPDEEPACPVSETCAYSLEKIVVKVSGGSRIIWIDVSPIPTAPSWADPASSSDPYSYPDATAVAANCAPSTGVSSNFPISTGDMETVCPRGEDNVCIDLWIRDSVVLQVNRGDGRDGDPEAKPRNSRVQIVIPTGDLTRAYFTVSPSCFVINQKNQCFPPLGTGTGLNNVIVNRQSDGSITVDFTLRNSAVKIPGGDIPIGPALNGFVTMKPIGGGKFSYEVERDQFPSMGIYQWQSEQRTTIAEFQERNAYFLMDWLNWLAPAPDGTCVKQ